MTDGAKVVFVENHGFGVRISLAKDAVFRYDEANKKRSYRAAHRRALIPEEIWDEKRPPHCNLLRAAEYYGYSTPGMR